MSKRPDAIGMFWEDLPAVKKSQTRGPRERGPVPLIPETGWKPPAEFPNLSASRIIGFDTETYDPELTTSGPGWARGVGHMIGASISAEDGTSWYFPIRHGIEGGKQVLPDDQAAMNMDPDNVKRWLSHVLGDHRPKVGANLIYDLGWCLEEGITVNGKLYDIQFAEALLNSETPDVTLDSLAHKYLGIGKETNALYAWLSAWCGGRDTDRQRANLYLSPPTLAGPYAEADASLPVHILNKQWPLLAERGVLNLFDMECRLIPLLVAMRFKGAPIDLEYAEKLHDDLGKDLEVPEKILQDVAGRPVNPNARDSIKSAFEALGLPVPLVDDKKTGGKKVSFAAPLLEQIDHPLTNNILEYRRIEKVRNTFVKGYILDKNKNGRIYCSFHPLKGEGGGTRSGRFSSSDPNLQNIPVRTEMGRRVRRAFVATQGGRWRKFDYSQIEYRMLAHHAVGPGAADLRQIYKDRPDADYHEITIALVKELTGIDLERRPAKNINFGLIYGMSEAKLSRDLGLSLPKGKELFKNYHEAAPFVRETMADAANEVNRLGYVTTILGRRSDFVLWGKKGWGEERSALPYERACREWGPYNIERAFTHKALNRRLQGGAADVMKAAMLAAYEAGLFSDAACGMPSLTVHDELDFDDVGDPDSPVWRELTEVMQNAVPSIRVPVLVDQSIGLNWGDAD